MKIIFLSLIILLFYGCTNKTILRLNTRYKVPLTVNVDTEELYYYICKDCHGINAEKKVFGKSKIIAKMSQDEIKKALLGYQNNTYGNSLNKVMQVIVNGNIVNNHNENIGLKKLSYEQIDFISKYISELSLKKK